MKLSETELKELARHLRCPDGETGIEIAGMMNFTNSNIITKAVDSIGVQEGDRILEIGPGNGNHVKAVLAKAEGVHYTGIDISATMVAEAQKLNAGLENVSFMVTDGLQVPFESGSFDKVFTTNTIYFWAEPEAYAHEIARVLKRAGVLSVGYIPESTMQKIPFAKYGFSIYSPAAVAALLENAGFEIISETPEKELVDSINGDKIEREIVITTAKKR